MKLSIEKFSLEFGDKFNPNLLILCGCVVIIVIALIAYQYIPPEVSNSPPKKVTEIKPPLRYEADLKANKETLKHSKI